MRRQRFTLNVLPAAALAALTLSTAQAQITVTRDIAAGNLSIALFDSAGIGCMWPVHSLQAHTSGTAWSSGRFTVGAGNPYGLTTLKGIVLSTGDVGDYSTGPNANTPNSFSYGVAATVAQEGSLDSIPGIAPSNWHDVTQFDVAFNSPSNWGGRLVFEVVFASDEYPAQQHDDAFALFHNGINIAQWTGDSVHARHGAMAPFTETEHDAAIARLPGGSVVSAVMTFVTPPIPPSTANNLTFIIGDNTDATVDSTVFITLHTEDCNANSIADYCDVVTLASADDDDNGIPDECEAAGIDVETFCVCDGSPIAGPCLNNVPVGVVAGCVNSTGLGGKLAVSGGLLACPTPVSFDVTDVRPNGVGILIVAWQPKVNAPAFADGRLCIKAPLIRLGLSTANMLGQTSVSPPITATNGLINCGETRYFQYWYRDPNGPCNKSSNLTNAVKVTF